MRRVIWVVAGVLVFVFVAAQLLIPGIGERRIEDRLTAGGGSAEVTLGAFPAPRLLFSDGERIEIEARELDLDLNRETAVFERLDGFGIVEIAIADSRAGPFELETFTLSRDGEGPYRLTSNGVTSPIALADYGLERFELPGEGLIDALLDPFIEQADTPVPLNLDMELDSDDGRIRVVSGGGTIAGVPMGALAQLITSAIVVQI